MLALFKWQKSDILHAVLTSSRGEGGRVLGLLLADAVAMTNFV
ncbi:MAG: hypothetical protein ABL996_09735 [Micropepsaceae bacterium]